jgi:molecular chaperone GrpE (heat shock protein)
MNKREDKQRGSNSEEKLKDKEKKARKEKEIESLKRDKLLLLAEIDNKHKDFQRQIEYVYKYGSRSIIARILDFLVDLEGRALKAIRNDLEDASKGEQKDPELINKFKSHLMGMEIIKNNLKKSLEDKGVKEIEVKIGETQANIRYHELIEEIEVDNLSEGTIIEVVEKGYFFHEEILRPTKVKIAKRSKVN